MMSKEKQVIQNYFLGKLLEAEQLSLEQDYFKDPRLFDRMVEVENELVDQYARGLLPTEMRDRFERHYLADPRRRERAKFAETLAARFAQAEDVAEATSVRTESSWARWLASMRGPKLAWTFSLALLLLTVGAVWLLVQSRRPQPEVARTEAGRAAQPPDANEQPVVKPSVEPERPPALPASPAPPLKPGSAIATLILTVSGTRSVDPEPPAQLVIPAGTEQVRLELNLSAGDYRNYRAALQAAGGREVFAWQRLAARTTESGAQIVLILPADTLADGDYIVTLRGVSRTGEVEDVSKSLIYVEKK